MLTKTQQEALSFALAHPELFPPKEIEAMREAFDEGKTLWNVPEPVEDDKDENGFWTKKAQRRYGVDKYGDPIR